MFLKQLSVINFKNYLLLEAGFSEKINSVVGYNGVGKTNLLDSINYLSLCKSYFNVVDSQNISFGQDFFTISGEYNIDGAEDTVFCGMKRNGRKIFRRNGKEYGRLSDHIGLLPLVMISPADSSLITEGSEERRRFINSVISQYDRNYLENSIAYNRALAQRNILLKEFERRGTFDEDSLLIWDEQLVRYGIPIYEARLDFISKLIPVFRENYGFVSGGREKVDITYQSDLLQGDFMQLLANNRAKDRALQYTSVGIHKDDLLLQLDTYQIKRIGSQGQQKTFLVALKLAEYEFIREIKGFHPLLLLDDIFDKFDTERVKQIIRLVCSDKFGQIFVTDTNEMHLKAIFGEVNAQYSMFRAENNSLTQV